jgi:hypothetical protein
MNSYDQWYFSHPAGKTPQDQGRPRTMSVYDIHIFLDAKNPYNLQKKSEWE